MGREQFEIATEDGELFCRCDDSGDSLIFIGKEGRVSLSLLLKQAHDPDFAKKMRGKKIRKQTGNNKVS